MHRKDAGEDSSARCFIRSYSVRYSNVAYAGTQSSDPEEILRQVITLARRKILFRLRSKHAPWPRKPGPAIPQLAGAMKIIEKSSGDSPNLQAIKDEVVKMHDNFTKLEGMTKTQAEGHEGSIVLGALVRGAHRLGLQDRLDSLINSIPDFGEEKKSRILITIQKLGRYYSACLFLISAAKRPIFRRVKIRVARFKSPYTRGVEDKYYEPSLLQTLTRVLPKSSDIGASIRSVEYRNRLFNTAENTFRKMMSERHRIHAEIQLLFFYELNHVPIRPRVISSSKSACFLCDLFVKIHEGFCTPRTHGVLYHQWRLPGQETLASLPKQQQKKLINTMQQFNMTIEDAIRSKFDAGKKVRRQPNESVVNLAPLWSTLSLSRMTSAGPLKNTPNEVFVAEERAHPSKDLGSTDVERRQSTSTELLKVTTPRPIRPIAANPTCPPLGSPEKTTITKVKSSHNSSITQASASTYGLTSQRTYPLSETDAISLSETEALLDLPALSSCPKLSGSSVHQESPYEVITHGESIERELQANGHPLRLSTRHIHVTITTEEITQILLPMKEQYSSSPSDHPSRISVKVTYLPEHKRLDSVSSINIQDLLAHKAITVSEGAVYSSNDLYLSRKTDTINIKYAIKKPDLSG